MGERQNAAQSLTLKKDQDNEGVQMSSLRIELRFPQPQCGVLTTVRTRHVWKALKIDIYS